MSLPVYFAPLQGYTDVVYRKAHAALFGGIAAYYTPFVRIEKGDFRRKDLRDIDFENNRGVPVVPQAYCGLYGFSWLYSGRYKFRVSFPDIGLSS